jgi:hypothetical protein
MALSLVVPMFPGLGEEIAVSFGTGALVTGIALIATGFTQGIRGEIAYYQEAIIVQMAGMGAGPAALAWLNDKPDVVFFALTILYAIIMAGYLFYTVGEQNRTGGVLDCFLDQVPGMYGKTAMKIANSIIIAISLGLIIASILARYLITKSRQRANDKKRHHRLFTLYRWIFTILVFLAETALAVMIQFTLAEYSTFVSAADRAEIGAWAFGQIVPLMMLLAPFMDVIRAVMDNIKERREAKKEKENSGNSIDMKGDPEKQDGDLTARSQSSTFDGGKMFEVTTKSSEVVETIE